MTVRGRVFVVTGGGAGIGRAVVLALLAQGATVAAVDRSADGLAGTVAAAGEASARLTTHVADLARFDEVDALPAALLAAHGALDGLLLVAGIIQPFVPVADLPWETVEKVMAVNFFGPLRLTRALLPHLRTRPAANVVAVSSMGGFVPVPGQSIYGASKAALKLAFEGLHAELRETPVRVTVVYPGAVRTDIMANSGVARIGGGEEGGTGSMLTPEQAAEQILAAMEASRFRAMVGRDAWMLDVMSRIAPARAASLIADKMASLVKT